MDAGFEACLAKMVVRSSKDESESSSSELFTTRPDVPELETGRFDITSSRTSGISRMLLGGDKRYE